MKNLSRIVVALFAVVCMQSATAGIISDYSKATAASEGWTIVHADGFGTGFDLEAVLTGHAAGTEFAFASSTSAGAATYDLFGSTFLNLLDIKGSGQTNSTTFADDAYWYWNDLVSGGFGSVGFADSSYITQGQADTASGDLRMSWHTMGTDGMTYGGWRSGSNTGLNSNNTWQRYVLVRSAAAPEPSVIGLMFMALVGMGLSRRTRRTHHA